MLIMLHNHVRDLGRNIAELKEHVRDLGRNIVELKDHRNAAMITKFFLKEILLTMLYYV